MKIKYLGTAAAEGVPAIFCECEICKKARALGGKNIRTRSQALIDDRLLVDFPPDTYLHFLRYNLPLEKIKTCIITHSHSDHLYADDFGMRKDGYSHLYNAEPFTVYSDKSGYEIINAVANDYDMPKEQLNPVLIKPFVPFDTSEGYHITPIRASHDPNSDPLLFVTEKDGKSIFYANDSSEYCEESYECLKNIGHPLDVVSFDCTEGCNETTYEGHLCLSRCEKLRDRLKTDRIADRNTAFILNHFSHNGKDSVYDDFSKIAGDRGFIVTYDGMEYEF